MSQINQNLNFENQNETENQQNTEDLLFTTIGNIKKRKISKVKPSLPKWISESKVFCGDIQSNSSNLEDFETLIDERLINNLKNKGIKKFFPVQKEVIPKLIECLANKNYIRPSDICVLSPTGSGKTYAYSIPVVNHLLNRVVTQIRALIILPVIDLATQVYKVFQSLCKNTTLRVGLATSLQNLKTAAGNFFKLNADGSKYLCSIDILVATPGKLIDLIQYGNGFNLSSLEILIIDEADRMMNETQIQWLESIEYSVYGSNAKYYCPCLVPKDSSPTKKSPYIDPLCPCAISKSSFLIKSVFKILFSATFTTDPEKIDNLSLYHPILMNLSANSNNTKGFEPKPTIPENLKEIMIISDTDKKPLILWHLIKNLNYKRILCFTDSIFNAHRLCQLMQQIPEISVREFHSKQNIRWRTKILKKFQNGKIDIIVSTDMTARGMDIDGIDCIVCYDVPRNETAYVHRIGRTARAGKNGTAITLISPDQLQHFNIILRRAHNDNDRHVEKLKIKNSDLKQLIPIYKQALNQLQKDTTKKTKKDRILKKKQIDKSRIKI